MSSAISVTNSAHKNFTQHPQQTEHYGIKTQKDNQLCRPPDLTSELSPRSTQDYGSNVCSTAARSLKYNVKPISDRPNEEECFITSIRSSTSKRKRDNISRGRLPDRRKLWPMSTKQNLMFICKIHRSKKKCLQFWITISFMTRGLILVASTQKGANSVDDQLPSLLKTRKYFSFCHEFLFT